jgi:hypothetical protein
MGNGHGDHGGNLFKFLEIAGNMFKGSVLKLPHPDRLFVIHIECVEIKSFRDLISKIAERR